MTPTVASEALIILLEPRGARAALAAALGEAPYQVSRWLAAKGQPVPSRRALIEDLLGLSWRLWDATDVTPEATAIAVATALATRPGAVEDLLRLYRPESAPDEPDTLPERDPLPTAPGIPHPREVLENDNTVDDAPASKRARAKGEPPVRKAAAS